jgi:hypothetical protein
MCVKLPVVRASTWSGILACSLLVSGLATVGCGGGGDSSGRPPKPDDELAAAIERSASQRALEREQALKAVKTTPSSAPAPAAGSAESEGPAPSEAPATAGSGALLSAADRASFSRLAAQLVGEEGVAVTTLGRDRPVSRVGSLRDGVAWSTAKVPVAMAAISAGVAQQQDLVQAITASDNAAAERLWSALGAGSNAASAADAQLRAAGDTRTQIQAQRLRAGYTEFGQSQWALTDQARFVGGMSCTRTGGQLLDLMGDVVSGQRWGLGSAGVPAQFKGGWGPGVSPGAGDGWLDRQMGIVTVGGRPVAVAIATTAGDHATGTQALTSLARWVVTHVDASRAPRSARC